MRVDCISYSEESFCNTIAIKIKLMSPCCCYAAVKHRRSCNALAGRNSQGGAGKSQIGNGSRWACTGYTLGLLLSLKTPLFVFPMTLDWSFCFVPSISRWRLLRCGGKSIQPFPQRMLRQRELAPLLRWLATSSLKIFILAVRRKASMYA